MRVLFPIVASVVLAGCPAELPDPVVRTVQPDAAWNGEDTLVTIEGRAFYPQVEIDARSQGEGDLDAGFVARLMTGETVVTELAGTGLIDFEHLQAVVPAGIDPGVYAIEVQGPTGNIGRLDAAFTVTDSRADRLYTDVESLVYEVFDTAWVTIELVDTSDERVPSDVAIVVDVTHEVSGEQVAFETAGLDRVSPLQPGRSLRGQLGPDGQARVGVRASTPGTTIIRVSPEDPLSAVADGEVRVLWEPGSELSLDIQLPQAPFEAVAGVPFQADLTLTDQFGNPVFDANETVLLKNACETWVDAVTVAGPTSVQVLLRDATGTASCGTDSILTVSGPQGSSDPFEVRPGAVERFDVLVNPGEVTAGQGEINVFITPVDRFGNLTQGAGGELTLQASTGEQLVADCVGTTPIFCTATPTLAGDSIELTVSDGEGLSGTSNPYTVVPGSAISLSAAFAADPIIAGEPVTLTADARDAFGNAVPLGDDMPLDIVIDGAPADCVESTSTVSGQTERECTLTLAQDDVVATVTRGDLQAQTAPTDVINGPLFDVLVTLGQRTAVAGQAVTLELTGRDAFGNAARVLDDPVLALADTTGTLSASSVALGGAGTASLVASVTRIGDTRITARQNGVALGESSALRILPDVAVSLAIDTDEPWAFAGESFGVVVRAEDQYGNAADSSALVTLGRSVTGDAFANSLDEGQVRFVLDWPSDVQEELVATGGSLQSAERTVLVVRDCGEAGPVAAIDFSGELIGRACADSSNTGAVTLSLADSQPGAVDIDTGVVAVDADVVNALAPAAVPLSAIGRTVFRGLVRDVNGCGAEASGEAWLGVADGTPTGPLPVSTSDPILVAGLDQRVLTIDGAVDCSGQAATGEVFVRATRGEMVSATPTGSGLVMQLDVVGDASVTLDATQVVSGGAGNVVFTTATSSAQTVLPIVITGDIQHPRVVDVQPSGRVIDPVSTVVVQFDEPLLDSSVVPENFRLDGPAIATVTLAELSDNARTVTLTVEPAVDPLLGTWAIVATRDVRDAAGNRLDGTYSGGTFDFTIPLGDVPAPGSGPTNCSVDRFRLRPDGDDGLGIEGDRVGVSWTGTDTPLWWVARVQTDTGHTLRTDIVAATQMDGMWSWVGRDDSGRVVADGTYTIDIDARDENGNHIPGCSTSVTIDNEAIRER